MTPQEITDLKKTITADPHVKSCQILLAKQVNTDAIIDGLIQTYGGDYKVLLTAVINALGEELKVCLNRAPKTKAGKVIRGVAHIFDFSD